MAPSRGTTKLKKGSEKNGARKKASLDPKSEEPGERKGTATLSIDLQQKIINIFRDAFQETIDSDIARTLQEIKTHLYNREFSQAFGRKEYLEAYAVRWSPSRALCYAEIFCDVVKLHQQTSRCTEIIIASLGGGAGAEVVGLAGTLRQLSDAPVLDDDKSKVEKPPTDLRPYLHAVDIADWSSTIAALHAALTTTPPISKYASEAAKATNCPMVNKTTFDARFEQADLLKLNEAQLRELIGKADLITLMFTLNELYSTSLPATQEFLETLTGVAQTGALLLVVDSPGSYSTITLNGKEKQYPMHWLVDHTLLKQQDSLGGNSAGHPRWDKLRTEDSTWFRLPEGLNYPIQLENMRYQLHLYVRK